MMRVNRMKSQSPYLSHLSLRTLTCMAQFRHTPDIKTHATIEVTEAVREWEYGDYEGRVTKDIKADREKRGLGKDWDIWRDGCEGGESPEDVSARLDKIIYELREKYHKGPFRPVSVPVHSYRLQTTDYSLHNREIRQRRQTKRRPHRGAWTHSALLRRTLGGQETRR
jgi:hypothetical protein